MTEIKIKTTKPAVPMIYAYTTPEIKRHDGWIKIGYTEQDVGKRLAQQMHTADVQYQVEWQLPAIYEDGSGESFRDTDFHRYLALKNVERTPGTEWFHIMPRPAKDMLRDFRERTDDLDNSSNATITYKLREEQEMAIQRAIDYRRSHEGGEFLWNCKPRFGKTLAVYDLAKRIEAKRVLIVTNRPSIANSWYEDYIKFFGNSVYYFATNNPALKNKKYTVGSDSAALIGASYFEFESLQDLKGSIYFSENGKHDKYKKIANTTWDLLVIDEAHEGTDTYKSDILFDHIKRNFTIHLSGTPFKAIANNKFPRDAIFEWTYADEQNMKAHWDEKHPDKTEQNPYEILPQLNLFTYQMSEMIRGVIQEGIDINGNVEEYAFDLNEFFKTNENTKRFEHEAAVNRFLDALTTQEKYPFSTEELRNELKHTMWLLERVDSAKALAKKLKDHPVFKDYEIVLAAGYGTIEDDEKETEKAYNRVKTAIENNDKTITLTVQQLTTGVTIPEWTGVLILSNVGSPSLYMQTAFRAQNPCLFHDKNGVYKRKERAYVFDFDPARTLDLYERFANDLNPDTSDGKGSSDQRKSNVKRLLNFFPVIGEDTEGKMIELDATNVLIIPRKIRSTEVVKKGFMSNFLFQNIGNIFSAPAVVTEILKKFRPEEEPKNRVDVTNKTASELDLDDKGKVNISQEKIDNIVDDIFGKKIFEEIEGDLDEQVETLTKEAQKKEKSEEEKKIEQLKETFKKKIAEPLVGKAKEQYGSDLTSGEQKQLHRMIETDVNSKVEKAFGNFQIQQNILEAETNAALNKAGTDAEVQKIQKEYAAKKAEAHDNLKKELREVAHTATKEAGKTIVEKVETHKRNVEKQNIENKVRDHLRGFSRTIPSFLMAYGTKETTLAIFDQIIPDEVFREVTSISLDEFRFLRDGGTYVDPENGEQKFYEGHLFDEVVFNDSVQEFIALKNKLSNYFDQGQEEDIFSYIPPQKTNQVFTQKSVVQEMLDMLETENPGCFNDSEATFADLYMKSGLYITEIVKRLFNSEELKRQYPNETDRLNHIFAKQVYGLAPTEIIYRIARTFILGFSDHIEIEADNIRLCDALQFAEDGTLEAKLKELFPELN